MSGTFQLTLSNGIVRLFSIISMPILTHLLSPHAYGGASLAGTVISLVSVIALAGIDMSYARAYHSALPPTGAVVEHYCWRFASIAALLSGFCGATAWWLIGGDSGAGMSLLIALGIAFSVVQSMAQTRARLQDRYRALARSTVASGALVVVTGIGIAALWRQDAIALLLPIVLGYVLPVLFLGMPSIASLRKPSPLSSRDGIALVKIGLAGVVTAPMYWFLSSSDRWFLQHYHGDVAVGIYSIGYSVGIVGMMINAALTSVWMPEAAREYERDRTVAQFTLGRLMGQLVGLMALIWLAVAAAGGDIIRFLANERFHGAAEYVPYIAGGIFFYGVLHLANTGLLLAKELNWAALWWLAGGVLCLVLNWILVPFFGGLGAALTQCLCFAFISFGILATSQSKFHLQLDWGRLLAVLLIVVPSGALMAPRWDGIALLSLSMKLPIGLLVSALVAYIMEPDWRVKACDYMRQRAIA